MTGAAAAASVACLCLPLFGLGTSPAINALFLILSLWMTVRSIHLLKSDAGPALAMAAFKGSTTFLALVMVLLSADVLLRRG